jgi:hypothetical protein
MNKRIEKVVTEASPRPLEGPRIDAKRHPMAKPRYQVVELHDGERLPRYVTMQRAGESFVEMAWECRFAVDNALMRWLRSLSEPPKCRVLLGATEQLTVRTARQLVHFRREEIARMAGSWPEPPDFALWLPVNRGGNTHRRAVCRVRGDVAETFASIEDAARAVHSSRDDVDERIDSGHRDAAGWSWWDAQPQGV